MSLTRVFWRGRARRCDRGPAGAAKLRVARPTVPGGSFRLDVVGASWQIDPAVTHQHGLADG